MQIKSPKNFWAGLMFSAFGLFFLVDARNYRLGSATKMGPAYFPTVLGGLMVVLGAIIFFQSFVVKGQKVSAMSFRPLFFIILGLLLFGYLLESVGLVIALALLIVISALAGYQFKLKEALILSVLLIVFSALVFVKGLGLPFPLWPKFPG
jgi:hypothetical protein